MESRLRLGVRHAFAEVQASAERVTVASAAVAQAESSHRIVQNRYEAGLVVVTELIRSETALLDARLRYLAALYDQRVARVVLDAAAGTLTQTSASLR